MLERGDRFKVNIQHKGLIEVEVLKLADTKDSQGKTQYLCRDKKNEYMLIPLEKLLKSEWLSKHKWKPHD